MRRCNNCYQRIDYKGRWIHVDTGSVYCDLDGKRLAVPSRDGDR